MDFEQVRIHNKKLEAMSTQGCSCASSNKSIITDEMLTPFVANGLPTSQVELSLSCTNLINADFIKKSNPYCVVMMKEACHDQYNEITRTEILNNTLNPQWMKKVILNYSFEAIQKIKFVIYDQDYGGSDFLGAFETTLSELVCMSARRFTAKLSEHSNRDCGEIHIVTEEVAKCNLVVKIQFAAEKLTKLSMLSANNPFLVISRSNEDATFTVVTKTETAISTQNPIWIPFVIRATALCNGDFDRDIKIDCFDKKSNKLIGTCHTTLKSLSSTHQSEPPMILINEEKQKAHSSHTSDGQLKVAGIQIVPDFTFLDYIRNGTQLHFTVAIDFTVSNLDHMDSRSLHYLCPFVHCMNQYELALRAVGEILQHYNSSQIFPAFGFGAKLPPYRHVSHIFPLNGDPLHPNCSSIDEILYYYQLQLKRAQLFGPTNFAPVIRSTSSIANRFQNGRHYFVLLIITDGIISDMQQTKRAIIAASGLPISIIIVGVGDADFGAMDELDSDDILLNVDGCYAERDIVQFVPLNKFLTQNRSSIRSQALLAKEVLAEVPEQLTGFMKSRHFKPKMENLNNLQTDSSAILPTAPLIGWNLV